MSAGLLNVADIRHHSRVNGPGLRSVVWVQGCTIGCSGCFNPHTHAHKPVRLLDPQELGRRIAGIGRIGGLTISGGEPFEQAEACAILAGAVRQRGLSVMVFTGYPYARLRASTLDSVNRFLTNIDVLVAGPYIARLSRNDIHWRASTNQTLSVLTERGREAVSETAGHIPVAEITTDGRNTASTGFLTAEDRDWLERAAGGSLVPLRVAPEQGEES